MEHRPFAQVPGYLLEADKEHRTGWHFSNLFIQRDSIKSDSFIHSFIITTLTSRHTATANGRWIPSSTRWAVWRPIGAIRICQTKGQKRIKRPVR